MVISSIAGYNQEIGCLQYRQRPRNKIQEIKGIRSYQARVCLQWGQCERGHAILAPRIKRKPRTFKNEPQQAKKGIRSAKIVRHP